MVIMKNIHIKKIKLFTKTKMKRKKHINFKLYNILKHPSQKFYKWYCSEGGIGRRIDNERQTGILSKRE